MGIKIMLFPFIMLIGAYILADLLMTAAAVLTAEKKHPVQLLLPFVFLLLHLSYGWGTIAGIIELPFWKSRLDGSAQKEIENVKECVIKNTSENVRRED